MKSLRLNATYILQHDYANSDVGMLPAGTKLKFIDARDGFAVFVRLDTDKRVALPKSVSQRMLTRYGARNLTVALTPELAKRIEQFPDANWSAIVRKAIEEYIDIRTVEQNTVQKHYQIDDQFTAWLKANGIYAEYFNGNEAHRRKIRDLYNKM